MRHADAGSVGAANQFDLSSQNQGARNIMSPRTLEHLRTNGRNILSSSKPGDASGLARDRNIARKFKEYSLNTKLG